MVVVIVGEFDSDNIGDQLIAEGQAALFAGKTASVCAIALEPERQASNMRPDPRKGASLAKKLHRFVYQRHTLYRHAVESATHLLRWREYRCHAETTLTNVDALIVGGGQLMSDGTLRMLHRLDHLTKVAQQRRIPVVAFGTGVSPGRSSVSRYLLRRVLERLGTANYFRDSASMEAARKTFPQLSMSAEPTPDCAIGGIVARGSLDLDARLVGIAPMSPAILARMGIPLIRIDEWWMDIIRCLCADGVRPVLFSTGVHADMAYAASLRDQLDKSGLQIELLPRPTCSEGFLNSLRPMRSMLAQRLHASISYYALGGVPASATWDRKVGEFYCRIALPHRLFRVGEGSPAEIARALVVPGESLVDRFSLALQSRADAAACMTRLVASAEGCNFAT